VAGHGLLAQHQFFGDVTVGLALRNEAQHLDLTRAQTCRQSCPSALSMGHAAQSVAYPSMLGALPDRPYSSIASQAPPRTERGA
jgi:hypothetical protein